MKLYITILLLTLTVPLVLQAAPDYTVTNKHRVIQEVSLSQNKVPIDTELPRLNFTTLSGDTYTLDSLTEKGPVAALFLATQCPVAQRYTTRLKRLHTKFTTDDKHTTFVGIYANEEDTLDDVKTYIQKAGYTFPIVKDTTGYLAELLGATMTPQAIVLDTSGTLRYRGPIDDNRYENRVKHNYLHDALLATHTGDSPPLREAPAFGCTIHLPETGLPSEVTYSENIATILQNNCQTCHRHGEVAPFTLTDYGDAKAWATEIAIYTQARLMPPWKPAPGYGHFKNERRLTDSQVELIARWVDAGTPPGNLSTVPTAPEFHDDWALGEPDQIFEMPVEYQIGAEGEDEYRQFIIPTNFETDMYIQAVDVQPGNRKTVHHVIPYLDVNGEARKLDAQDPKPGYVTDGTGPGFDAVGSLGGWAPGVTPSVLPEGVGYLLPKGADIVMQVHYYRTGHVEYDRSRLGLYFSKTPDTARLHIGSAINSEFVIPPGEAWYEVLASREVEEDVYLLGAMPHMHLLGRDMRLVATTPEGEAHDLIWIKDWDFNWQDVYRYQVP